MIPVTVEKRPPVELITQEDQKDPQYPEDFETISQDGAQMLIMRPAIFIQSHTKMQKQGIKLTPVQKHAKHYPIIIITSRREDILDIHPKSISTRKAQFPSRSIVCKKTSERFFPKGRGVGKLRL